jgi:hypothetical protein
MTIDEFKPGATKLPGEDASGKVFASVRLNGEPSPERGMAKTKLTYSSHAPTVDQVRHNDCRRARAAVAHLGGPHQHAIWLRR